ncbi:MAG: efflux transporter periplasmic adaptor subunit [Flavobacteriaceae bacterium]|nr:efflux transporter periplasmic adaptor subunit [Flavobacteriaceae bacterium]
MKKINTLPALLLVSMMVIGCGNNEAKETSQTTSPIEVTVAHVSENGTAAGMTVSGKVQAEQSAQLSTRAMGNVTTVNAQVGATVTKGTLLVALNSTDLQARGAQGKANLAEATAAYKDAEKEYARFTNLYSQNSASRKELDDREVQFQMAQARLEAARQLNNEVRSQYTYTNITAPFTGVVTSVSVQEGDLASPGQPLVTMESPTQYEVIAMVPEAVISEIEKGMEVTVYIKALNNSLKGKVSEISTSSNATGGQYLVTVTLPSTEDSTFSGMYASVLFPIERKNASETILIPKSALVHQGQLTGVYTVSQEGKALLRWLRLGKTYGEQIEVLSGISAGEQYIVASNGRLYNGATIALK